MALMGVRPLAMYTLKTGKGIRTQVRARVFAARWLRGDVRGAAALVQGYEAIDERKRRVLRRAAEAGRPNGQRLFAPNQRGDEVEQIHQGMRLGQAVLVGNRRRRRRGRKSP